MRKPNFFIAGAPKCGTTSLFDYLSRHPEIYLSPRKEPQYFGSDFTRKPFNEYQHIGSEAAYLALFSGATTQKRIGEGSTSYFYSRSAAHEIKAFNPASRIILMLRSPVEMMLSMYYEQHFHGYDPLPSFAGALEAESERKAGRQIPSRVYILESLFYREIARYDRHVQRFFEVFGRENVHIIIFDDFKADVARVYRDTLTFLEVDPDFRTDFQVLNTAKTPRSKLLRNVLQNPPPALLSLGQLMMPISRPVYRHLRRWNARPITKEPMPAELRSRLQAELRPEIEVLSHLLGRDLTHWCQ